MSIIEGWFEKPIETRHEFIKSLSPEQMAELCALFEHEYNTPYAMYQDDPMGFCTFVLNEFLWSKQREICDAVRDHRKVAIPATNSCGKSYLMSRLVAWFVCVNDPNTTRVVSTAPTARQVNDILWNELRKVHSGNDLPGRMTRNEWRIDEVLVANGFTSKDQDETKMQGIHEPNILIIVDEAAGISPLIGESFRAIYTNSEARIVAIGNPPTDDAQGYKWFEGICTKDNDWEVIKIAAWDLPCMTGEWVPDYLADGLTGKDWVQEIIDDFGPDHPWYKARLDVEFVESSAVTMVPKEWVYKCLGHYDRSRSGPIRIGVDVASTGGDEFVVAEADGQNYQILHRSSGTDNSDQTELADIVMDHIQNALNTMRNRIQNGALEQQKLIVLIDGGGLGGPVGDIISKEVRSRDLHMEVRVDKIDFGSSPQDKKKFFNIRAEMYWIFRELLRSGDAMLIEDKNTTTDEYVSQISGVRFSVRTEDKRMKLESKKDMKRRGMPSPDIADALCLAAYLSERAPAMVNSIPGDGRDNGWAGIGLAASASRQAGKKPKFRYYT